MAILRADKLLTTSLMGQLSVENRIASPSAIYPLLERYDTRFVVLEDRPSGSIVLDWLRTAWGSRAGCCASPIALQTRSPTA